MFFARAAADAAGVRAWHLASILVLLAAGVSIAAQAPGAPPPQSHADASIRGVVIDMATVRPLPHVTVVLPNASRRTTTDEHGAFEFAGVPAGVCTLRAEIPGRAWAAYGQLRPDGDASFLVLDAGTHVEGIQLRSWPQATIAGRVTDPDGQPVPHATVEVARRVFTLESFRPDYRHELALETDADGRYHAELPAGHLLATVRLTNVTIPDSVQNGYHQEIATPAVGDMITRKLARASAPMITGRSAHVGAFRVQVMSLGTANAPAPIIGDAVATTYRASARALTLEPGATTSADFQLQAVRAFAVSGVVSAAPGVNSYVAVRLTRLDEPAMMQFSTGPAMSSETAIGLTDASGAFTLLGVPAGRYELFVRNQLDGPPATARRGGTVESARTEITVAGTDVANVTLPLRQTPVVRGRVEFVGDPPPTPAEISAMRFGLYEDLLSSTPKPVIPPLASDGSFALGGDVPDRYWPTADLGQWAITDITIGGQSFDDRIVVIGDEGVPDVRVIAAPWKTQAQVWGTVHLPAGVRFDDIDVALFPMDYAERMAGDRFNRRRVRLQRLRSSQFNLAYLPPGTYNLVAYREVDGADPERPFFDRLAAHAIRLFLPAGQPQRLDLSVAEMGR